MSLLISRILHAGLLFEGGGARIVFDPLFENPFSRNCHAFPAVRFDPDGVRALAPTLDAIFISHLHDDHCSLESLALLDRATPVYIYCLFDELPEMIGQLGFTSVRRLHIDQPVRIAGIEVTPRLALDADVDALFQVRCGAVNVLNVVDAWIGPEVIEQLAHQRPWDLVIWPYQAMRELAVIAPSRAPAHVAGLPDDWIDQLRQLAPRFVVPGACQFLQEDWSWYNHAMFPITYQAFAGAVEAALPATRVQRLDPGVAVRLDGDGLTAAPRLPWVVPVGPQDVDYDFQPAIVPPSTAAIARHFAALAPAQMETVLAFCREGLLARYRAMQLPDDSYFVQPRTWCLRLYDHAGACSSFSYRIEGDTIELLEGALSQAPLKEAPAPGWLTEVAAAKVHAALTEGESLTSLYMRINDAVFDADSERDLVDADIVDDPLIRCLFDGAVGAYQAAQLRRLQTAGALNP